MTNTFYPNARQRFFALCLSLMIVSSCGKSDPQPARQSSATPPPPPIAASVADVRASNWSYDTTRDEMRGTSTYHAVTYSSNTLEFDFPYSGGSTATLRVRKRPSELAIMLSVSKGQFQSSAGEIAVKFDDGPVQNYTINEPADHSSDLLFIEPASKFLSKLKKAERVTIEAPFYSEGKRLIVFDVEGLR